MNKEDKEKLLTISENIENMMLKVNEETSKFLASDTFKALVDLINSIPNDLQETSLYRNIASFSIKEIQYDDMLWMEDILGYRENDTIIDAICNKKERTELDNYICSIILGTELKKREKLIVLLAHFESLVYQTIMHSREPKDRIKMVMKETAEDAHDWDLKNYKKILIAGLVYIVFSNTDKYKGIVDKRIPFRNHICTKE